VCVRGLPGRGVLWPTHRGQGVHALVGAAAAAPLGLAEVAIVHLLDEPWGQGCGGGGGGGEGEGGGARGAKGWGGGGQCVSLSARGGMVHHQQVPCITALNHRRHNHTPPPLLPLLRQVALPPHNHTCLRPPTPSCCSCVSRLHSPPSTPVAPTCIQQRLLQHAFDGAEVGQVPVGLQTWGEGGRSVCVGGWVGGWGGMGQGR
jgi:hypothetical protein